MNDSPYSTVLPTGKKERDHLGQTGFSMYICQDTSGRYTLSMYWYRREFFIVTKEITSDREIKQIDAARYPHNLAETLMNSILSGERRIEGLEFDQATAYAIVGRIAEGLRAAEDPPPNSSRRTVRWN